MSEENNAVATEVATEEQQFVAPEPPTDFDAYAMGLGDTGKVVEGGFDPSLFEGVAAKGEVIPNGIYAFKLTSYKTGFTKPWQKSEAYPDGRPEYEQYGEQPYYNITATCTQEPHTGKKVYPMVNFVNQKTQLAAKGGDTVAQKLVRDRLIELKALLKGCVYQPTARFDVGEFLNTHPELRIELGQREGQVKIGGKYVPSGQRQNTIVAYHPKNRPV